MCSLPWPEFRWHVWQVDGNGGYYHCGVRSGFLGGLLGWKERFQIKARMKCMTVWGVSHVTLLEDRRVFDSLTKKYASTTVSSNDICECFEHQTCRPKCNDQKFPCNILVAPIRNALSYQPCLTTRVHAKHTRRDSAIPTVPSHPLPTAHRSAHGVLHHRSQPRQRRRILYPQPPSSGL